MEPGLIPQTLDELTPEWLTGILHDQGVLGGARVIGYESEFLSDVGLIGFVYRLALTYEGDEPESPRTLIAKMPTNVTKNRAIGDVGGDYEREVRFYQDLAQDLPIRSPGCYAALFQGDPVATSERRLSRTTDQRFILLLEDMAPARVGDDAAGCGVEEATTVLRAAARLHASLWDSPRLDDLWWAWRVGSHARASQMVYRNARSAFDQAYRDRLPPFVFALLDWLDNHGEDLQRGMRRPPSTVLHVDFRLDNLFFAGTRPADVIFFDWQACGIGPAARDVASFLSNSLRVGVGSPEIRKLLATYHDTLVEHGVENYTREALEHDYEACLVLTLRGLVTNFSHVDWGDGRELERHDVQLERKVERLESAEPGRLLA